MSVPTPQGHAKSQGKFPSDVSVFLTAAKAAPDSPETYQFLASLLAGFDGMSLEAKETALVGLEDAAKSAPKSAHLNRVLQALSTHDEMEARGVTGQAGALPTRLQGFSLPVGKTPNFLPTLTFSDLSIPKIVKNQDSGGDTLIITDAFNRQTLKGREKMVTVTEPSVEVVRDILAMPSFGRIKNVLGVGGGASLDVARAVAVKASLTLITSLLSTNCIANNRSVLDSVAKAFSYQSATPRKLIVSIADMMSQDPKIRKHWTQSGLGDFFGGINAFFERQENIGGALTRVAVLAQEPTLETALEWVLRSFPGYDDADALKRITEILYASGAHDVVYGTNADRIGGEHLFYKSVMELYPQLRNSGPTHGQLVAMATLVGAKRFSKKTGDDSLYRDLRAAFVRLGLPVTYAAIGALGLRREQMHASFLRMTKADFKSSGLGDYIREHGLEIVDEVFDGATPR